MPQVSAGLLMFSRVKNSLKLFLVHPGGPFFKNKDLGAWSVPKGLQEEKEELLETAQREFLEETNIRPVPPFMDLGVAKLKGGKIVYCWAFETESEVFEFKSNTFEMEWPPRSGRKQVFPEIDKANLFSLEEASEKINPAQKVFIHKLLEILG